VDPSRGALAPPGILDERRLSRLRVFSELAMIAERGLLDFLFFRRRDGIPSTWKGSIDDAVKWGVGWPRQDMSPTSRSWRRLPNISASASRIPRPSCIRSMWRGCSTRSITSRGEDRLQRIASSRRADAANYGFDELMEHDLRYERMEEFMAICKALGRASRRTLCVGRETGSSRSCESKAIDHKGDSSASRPTRLRAVATTAPVIIQAGASPRDTASAIFADHVFAASPGLAKQ